MSAPRTQVRDRSRPQSAVAAGRPRRRTPSARRRASRLPSATSEMAHEGHQHRGVDTALRALDLGDRGHVAGGAVAGAGRDRRLDPAHLGQPRALPRPPGGRAGRIFTMLKFRTLTPDAEARLGPYLGDELTQRTAGRGHAPRPRAALRPPRRAAAAVERAARRHEHRRAASDPARVLRGALRADPAVLAAAGGGARA